MTSERIFSELQKIYADKAAASFAETASLITEGKLDQADITTSVALGDFGRTKIIDAASTVMTATLSGILNIFSAEGIELPNLDYFQHLAKQPISMVRTETVTPKALTSAPTLPIEPTQTPSQTTSPPAWETDIDEDFITTTPPPTEPVNTISQANIPAEYASLQVPPVERGERKDRTDLSFRQELLGYHLFALNPTRTNFAFETWKDAWTATYQDRVANIPDPKTKAKKLAPMATEAKRVQEVFIRKLLEAYAEPELATPYMAKFIAWLKAQPEYEGLDANTLEKIALGDLSFDDIPKTPGLPPKAAEKADGELAHTNSPIIEATKPAPVTLSPVETIEKVNPKLTTDEMYFLAGKLAKADEEALKKIGIRIHPDDKELLLSMVEQSPATPLEAANHTQTARKSLQKLIAFTKDQKSAIIANMDSDDAQFVLTFFAGIKSEQILSQLVTSEG